MTHFLKELLLGWAFTTTGTPTRPSTNLYIALHTDDPGADGDANEVVVGTDADYVRKAITYDDPVSESSQVISAGSVTWTVNGASGGYTVTHISVWDASTSGNCLMYGELAVAEDLVALAVLTFATGKIRQIFA